MPSQQLDELESASIVRPSKIEVYPQHIGEYMKYAAEAGEISLRTEPDVLREYRTTH